MIDNIKKLFSKIFNAGKISPAIPVAIKDLNPDAGKKYLDSLPPLTVTTPTPTIGGDILTEVTSDTKFLESKTVGGTGFNTEIYKDILPLDASFDIVPNTTEKVEVVAPPVKKPRAKNPKAESEQIAPVKKKTPAKKTTSTKKPK